MLYPWLTPLLAAIACSVLTVFVALRGPKSELGRVFTLAGMVLTCFNLFYFVLYFVEDYETAFYLARVLRVGTLLTTPVGVHLAVALRSRRSVYWNAALAFNYALATLFILGNVFDLFVDGLIEIPWGYTTSRRPLYEILTVYTLANGLLAMGMVVYQYRTATDARTRLQSKFWMLGITAGISLGLTNFLPAYDVPIYPLGHFGSVAFAAILAYAIVRHRLMGVEVALTKGITYASVVLLIVAPAFAVVTWMQEATFGRINYEFSLGILALLLFTGVVFPMAKDRLESRLAQSLFRERRANRAALANFAKAIVRIIDQDELEEQLCETVQKVFGLDRIALFLLEDSGKLYREKKSVGAATNDNSIAAGHPLCRWLSRSAEPVLADEAVALRNARASQAVVAVLERNSWKVCVPLLSSDSMIGFLVLGAKADIEAYVREDLEALGVLGAEASIAFDNARLYKELRRSHDIIGRAGRLSAMGTFAAGIAHEIRNPLVSIQTFFQLAPDRLDDEEFMTSFLPLAEQELVRIRNLISELLSFARSPTATVKRVSMSDVVDRAMTLLAPHARKEHVSIDLDISPSGGDVVEADPDQLMQVVVNIVLNAIQASPTGGKVRLAVRRVSRDTGALVRTVIEDEGPGIAPESREAVFNPFYTTKDKGTGLGLSIVHRIVVDSGGSITVEDGALPGACFAIEFPAVDGEARTDVNVDDAETELSRAS